MRHCAPREIYKNTQSGMMEPRDTPVDRLENLEISMTHNVGKVILMNLPWRDDGGLLPTTRAQECIVAFS